MGAMQPQGHAQIVMNLVDFGMNLQEAGDAPRIQHEGSTEPTGQATAMTDGGEVNLETGFPYETVRALMRKGHRIVFADGPYGGYQAIMRDPETGVYYGLREPQGRAGGGVLRFPGQRVEPLCGGFRSGIACWAGWVGCSGTPQVRP